MTARSHPPRTAGAEGENAPHSRVNGWTAPGGVCAWSLSPQLHLRVVSGEAHLAGGRGVEPLRLALVLSPQARLVSTFPGLFLLRLCLTHAVFSLALLVVIGFRSRLIEKIFSKHLNMHFH